MTVTASTLADSVSPEAVHAHIPRRPVFTAASKPSLDEVATLTMSTALEVLGAVGGVLPDTPRLVSYAVALVERGTAAKVEGRFFPEQQVGASQYDQLNGEFQAMLTRLVAQVLNSNEQKRGGFGMISLHKRTAALALGQERAQLAAQLGVVPESAVIEATDPADVDVWPL